MKKMIDKVISKYCRRHYKVVWYDVYCEIRSLEMDQHFYLLAQKHPGMSFNRVAYNTIKKFYSTTAINELRAQYGVER